jgi:hypothetical protein
MSAALNHAIRLARKGDQGAALTKSPNKPSAQQAPEHEIDWKDQFEKQKRRAEMWISKYEKDIGPIEKAGPVAHPSKALPFGVGGGLQAIKTLLGRDPCAHANTAIAMIDEIIKAAGAQANRALEPVDLEPVEGDLMPAIGSRVFILHARDDLAHACTVTGFYVWADLGGSVNLHRVFVRLVYEGTNTPQARMLSGCWPTEAEALAAKGGAA